MKKILLIGEIILTIILLLGCSVQQNTDSTLINGELGEALTSKIEIEIDVYKKIITKQDDIELIANFIYNIEISNNEFDDIHNMEKYNIIRLKIYNNEGNITKSISISKYIAFYNNKWKSIDIKVYDKMLSLYKNINYEELKDSLLLDTKQKKLNRKEITTSEALQGLWLSENGTEMLFDKNYLYQGGQYEYKFKYDIDKTYDNNLNISIYGTKGNFVKGKKLSKIDIKMDETKTCMVIKKTMAGGNIYNERFIYVDANNIKLGTFDSYFFYKYSEY